MRGFVRGAGPQSSSPNFCKSSPLSVVFRISCQASLASFFVTTLSSALNLKTRVYGVVIFRLVDVQSTTANVLKLGLTAAATVLTAILDDFLVPSRMAASAASIRFASP